MKKELLIHVISWLFLFAFITLVRRLFNLTYWPFYLGGLVGTILPDIDHLIYIYILNPHELTSQRVNQLVNNGKLRRMLDLLAETRSERSNLIFHTAFFQIVFIILMFLVVTSSGSLFAKGLVLAFALHLSVDQVVDLFETGNLQNWFKSLKAFPVLERISSIKEQSTLYWLVGLLVILYFGFFL
jgi:hypothetical protein